MAPRINWLGGQLRDVNKQLRQELTAIGGGNSPEMRAAGKVLKKSIRRVLSVRGGGKPSAPGEAPRRQSGHLAKSVTDGPVGTGRRVGVLAFTGLLLEEGVDSSLPPRGGKRRRRRGGKAKGKLKINPRPFLQRAIDAVKDEMGDVIASAAGDRLGRL